MGNSGGAGFHQRRRKALMVLITVVVIGCIALAILTRNDKLHAQEAREQPRKKSSRKTKP